MDPLRKRLILKEAEKRLRDAEVLEAAGGPGRGDSDYLLRLLALELLLKFHYEADTGKQPPKNHKYGALFERLSPGHQSLLLEEAGNRIGPSDLSTRPMNVLEEWSLNFVLLRYPYEKYKGMTEQEFRGHSDHWLKEGTALEDADFRYYPEELYGFLHALQTVLPKPSDKAIQDSK